MKKFLTFLFLLCSITLSAQITLSKEQIDSLPQDVRNAIELSDKKQQVKKQMQTATEYASWGREIGLAVDGALGAVENHVVKLSETGLGHTVIFLVCWKFLARDIIGMIVGLSLFMFMIWLVTYHRKKLMTEDFKELRTDAQELEIGLTWLAIAVVFIASMMATFM